MALYVSKAENYIAVIHSGNFKRESVKDPITNQYENTMVAVFPYMKAEFHSDAFSAEGSTFLESYAREFARRYFDTPSGDDNPAWGPSRKPGVFVDPDYAGQVYEASNPEYRYSWFDTDVDIPAYEGIDADKAKELFEARLDAAQGPMHVRVVEDAIPAPWPSYNDMTTLKQGRTKDRVVADILSAAALTGTTLGVVLAYERTRPESQVWLVERLQAESAKQADEKAELAAMSVNA
jgi:hypothetical protein